MKQGASACRTSWLSDLQSAMLPMQLAEPRVPAIEVAKMICRPWSLGDVFQLVVTWVLSMLAVAFYAYTKGKQQVTSLEGVQRQSGEHTVPAPNSTQPAASATSGHAAPLVVIAPAVAAAAAAPASAASDTLAGALQGHRTAKFFLLTSDQSSAPAGSRKKTVLHLDRRCGALTGKEYTDKSLCQACLNRHQ